MTTTINPLTTTFTPPAACTTDTYYVSWSHSSDYTWRWQSLGAEDWSVCFPSNYAPTSYYSPGVCPEGYSAAGQTLVTDGQDVETRATCCPSFYNAQTGDDWPWYSTNPCTSSNDDPSATYSYTVTDSGAGTSTITLVGTYGVNAKGVSIRWRSADFATTTTSESVSSSTAASTASSTTSSTTSSTSAATTISSTADLRPTATNSGDNKGSGGGLSSGAKAGVGIGVAAGAILLMSVAFLFYRRRRRSGFTTQLDSRTSLHEIATSSEPSAEMDATRPRTLVELDATR